MYQSHYRDLRINSAFEKEMGWWWSSDSKAGSELCDIRNDGVMRHNKILDLVSGVRAIARPAGNRPLCRFHYAGIIAGHPGGEESDWWRAPGPSQQCLNSRAIVCYWKIREKKEGKGRRERGGRGRERKREKLSKVGGIIRPFLKTGKKWLGVSSVGSRVGLFLARSTFFSRKMG